MTPAEVIVDRVLDREGGVIDLGDGKGVTRYGQTPAWLAQFGLPVPQSRAQAATNYHVWLALTGLVLVVSVADDLADIVVDIAVMSGAPKGIKALQAVLDVGVDGVLGVVTLARLAGADRRRLARAVIGWDMEYQGALITTNPAKAARWAHGWAHRLADHVRHLT